MRARSGYAEIVACTLTWGTIGPITRHLAAGPVVIAFFRVAFGLAIVLAWLAARGAFGELRARGRVGLIVCSGVILATHWALQFEAFKRTSVATAILVIFLGPVLMAAAAPVVLRERARPIAYVALAVAFGGLALISLPKIGHASAAGLAAALGSALAFAALLLCDKVLTRTYEPAAIVVWQLAVALVVLSPALATTSVRAIAHGIGWLALIGIVHTGVLGIVFFHAVRALQMQRLGVLYYLEPASAILYAWWWVHEHPQAVTLAGGALIVLAGSAIILTDRGAEVPLPAQV